MKKIMNLGTMLVGFMALSTGCVVFLSTVAAVIFLGKSGDDVTVEVTLEKPADVVYVAVLAEIDADKELKLDSQDLEKKVVEVSKEKRKAKCTVVELEDGKCSLQVLSDAGTDKEDDDYELALKVVTRVCERLDIEYELVEKE